MDLINLSIGLGTGDNEPTAPGSHGFLDCEIQECKSLSTEFHVGWSGKIPPCLRWEGLQCLSEGWGG